MAEKDTGCAYCMEDEKLDKFGIKICDLTVSKLYLFKEQSHRGRVIVAYKDHVGDMTLLSDEERNAYFADIARVSRALQSAFHPDKVNYGAYGDTAGHLHFHLVPKYKGGYEWGGVFAMDPKQKTLSEGEYSALISQIKERL